MSAFFVGFDWLCDVRWGLRDEQRGDAGGDEGRGGEEEDRGDGGRSGTLW